MYYISEIGVNGGKLIIPNATRYATDVYTCRGANTVNQVEHTINLKVACM